MEARELFSKVNGATFVGIDTCTTVTLLGGKKNPMQGRVQKHMKGASVMVFQNKNVNGYESMVKRRLEAEGKDPQSFTLSPRKWGHRVEGLPLVEHNGELYLEVIFLKAGDVTYTLDGVRIAEEDIEGLPAAPAKSGQGGLDNQVVIRTFKLSSLRHIRIQGEEFNTQQRPQEVVRGNVRIVNYDDLRVTFEPA